MIYPIVVYGHPVLKKVAADIDRDYPDLQQFIADMFETMYNAEGLGLAAPQVGKSIRLFVIDGEPVAEDELLRCYSVLKEICDAKRKQGARIIPRAMAAAPLPASIVSNVGAQDGSLEAALYFVEQHFREKIRAEEVAKLCGMSSFRFSRSFKEKYGIAFRDYVVRYRLRQAHKMISEQNSSVTEAAYAVGFNDISYFGRMFKRHFDVAPSELTSVLPDANGDFSITSILKLPLH